MNGRSPLQAPYGSGIVAHHLIDTAAENIRDGAREIDLNGIQLTCEGRQVAFPVLCPPKREMHIVSIAVDIDPEAQQQRRAENGQVVVHTLVEILGAPEREFKTTGTQFKRENLQLAVVYHGVGAERVYGDAVPAPEQQKVAQPAHRSALSHSQIVPLYPQHAFERRDEYIHVRIQLTCGAQVDRQPSVEVLERGHNLIYLRQNSAHSGSGDIFKRKVQSGRNVILGLGRVKRIQIRFCKGSADRSTLQLGRAVFEP